MKPITVYTSQHWDMADSYGLIACQLARHLTALGVRVNAISLGKTVVDSQPDDIRAVTSRPILPTFGGIVMGYPTNSHHHTLLHYGPRVALTMFESTRLPSDWIEPLNNMDAVIVPSEFCATVFRDSGVSVPVYVVPLGIGESYTYHARTANTSISAMGAEIEGKGGRPLTFLAFFDRGERKGGMVAQQAFTRAFGDDMRYKLILKARTAKPGRELVLTNPNIEVIHQDMSEAELYALYCRCDILVNPHKGEGFGLIPREFAASGGCALTTGWSGTTDELDQWGYALPYRLERAHWTGNKTLAGQDLGEWAAVDPVRLAHSLKMVAATWQFTRQQLPAKAQAARELYKWDVFAQSVLNIWEGVQVGNRNRTPAIAA
jgi:glycosyltransferase involved in cell wall biosynthesis